MPNCEQSLGITADQWRQDVPHCQEYIRKSKLCQIGRRPKDGTEEADWRDTV